MLMFCVFRYYKDVWGIVSSHCCFSLVKTFCCNQVLPQISHPTQPRRRMSFLIWQEFSHEKRFLISINSAALGWQRAMIKNSWCFAAVFGKAWTEMKIASRLLGRAPHEPDLRWPSPSSRRHWSPLRNKLNFIKTIKSNQISAFACRLGEQKAAKQFIFQSQRYQSEMQN